MKKTTVLKIMFIVLVVLAVAACNLPSSLLKDKDDNEQSDQATEAPFSLGSAAEEEIDPNPVGLQAGLGSFDSYRLDIHIVSTNSKGAKTDINESIERSVVDKNSHSIATTTEFDPENDTEESTSTEEVYEVGYVTCTGSEGEWTYEEMTPQDKELIDVFKGMMDFVPMIENPQFIGEENINGIDCNHFTFQVQGIGDSSGSVATINSGDYWLAKDGNYIVKYHLILEIQSAATESEESETSDIEASLELSNTNVPLTITLPETCQPEGN